MTQGLKSHTIESQLIYFNSLLRGSLLYACETYVNLTEKEKRLIESTEEDCLVQLMVTGSHCSRSILYLELGLIPARFQIQKLMLNYLQTNLQENENSLLSNFFGAQVANPIRNDWASNIATVIKDIHLNLTFQQIRSLKPSKFHKIVDSKIKIAAFKYLKSNIKSKGKEINYGDQLRCQSYLLPNQILTHIEQKAIFSYRTRMNNLKYNFKGNKVIEHCLCGTPLTNEHLYQCFQLNEGIDREVQFQSLFNGTLSEQKIIIKILEENMIKHEKFTSAQDKSPLSH